MARKVKSETRRLREFGLVMAVALGVFGALAFFWRGHDWGQYLWYVGGAFLAFGLVAPRLLKPIEFVWMRFAVLLGTVMTTLILTLTFFVVMTPLGILLRLMGKDLLGMHGDTSIESYWVPIEEDGPAHRPDKPY